MSKQTTDHQELGEDGKRTPRGEKQDLGKEGILSLARSLTFLLNSSHEYCTPGHRMGHSYQLLLTHLQQIA